MMGCIHIYTEVGVRNCYGEKDRHAFSVINQLVSGHTNLVCLFLLLYVPCQQLWSLREGQFT